MIVELRSTGTQTLLPPSRHPSGELYEWHEEGEATKVSRELLASSIGRLAACVLVARYWPDGSRHDAALALSGGLLRAGWPVDRVVVFMETAATVAGDDEVEDRRRAVLSTAEKLSRREEATGWPRLSALVPEQIVTCIIKWLGIQSIGTRCATQSESRSISVEDWPDPEPLPDEMLPVPQMSSALLPEPFAPWLSDIAERMQCPLDYPAVGAIVALASVVGNQIAIRPKRYDDWSVVPNLYGAIVGRPGVLKSPALSEALKPIQRLIVSARAIYEERVSEWQIERLMTEAKREKLKEDIKKAAKSGKDIDKDAFRSKQGEIDGAVEPIERRYMINDSTVEKVGELLNRNPNGLLLFRDELTGWLHSLDRDGHESARSFYLEAWKGRTLLRMIASGAVPCILSE